MSSTARAASASDVPTIGWMLGMSSWMLLTLVPGAMFAWLGFGIVGVVSRSRRLIILGVVWGAVAILVDLELWGQAQPIVRAVAYLAGMVCALAVNPGWLRTMWQRRVDKSGMGVTSARATATGRAATSAGGSTNRPSGRSRSKKKPASRPQPAPSRGAAVTEGRPARTPVKPAPDEAAELADEAGASTDDLLAAPASAPAAAEPVDVNAATAAELEGLPGVTRARARKAVSEREEQGGFSSLEDFGETLGLQPHEIVRLRKVAVCSPRPRGERRFGRRVDY